MRVDEGEGGRREREKGGVDEGGGTIVPESRKGVKEEGSWVEAHVHVHVSS